MMFHQEEAPKHVKKTGAVNVHRVRREPQWQSEIWSSEAG